LTHHTSKKEEINKRPPLVGVSGGGYKFLKNYKNVLYFFKKRYILRGIKHQNLMIIASITNDGLKQAKLL